MTNTHKQTSNTSEPHILVRNSDIYIKGNVKIMLIILPPTDLWSALRSHYTQSSPPPLPVPQYHPVACPSQ